MKLRKKKPQRVFIVPTYSGIALGLGAFSLFFYSFLYGHGPSYVLSIVLITFFLAIGFMSNNNIRDIELLDSAIKPIESEQTSNLALSLSNLSNESKLALQVRDKTNSRLFNLKDNQKQTVGLSVSFPRRGVYEKTRIRLQSKYPLGLFYCWRTYELTKSVYVYPSPKPYKISLLEAEAGLAEGRSDRKHDSGEEFSRYKAYQVGDAMARIDWKRLAKNDELLTKINEGYGNTTKIIDWNEIGADDLETKLSFMSFLLLHYSKQNFDYRLSLPDYVSEIGKGETHLNHLLEKLASIKEGDYVI